MTNKPSKEELCIMLDEGQTLYQISRKFNTNVHEVQKWRVGYDMTFSWFKIPKPTKQDLESMYHDEGMTQWRIAQEFDVHRVTAGSWLSYYGISTVCRNGAPVSTPQKDVLEQMYHDKRLTQEQIAKEFGVGTSTVGRWLRYHGIPTRGNGTMRVKMPAKEELYRMYTNEHMTQWGIAKELGVDVSTISIWMSNYGIRTIGYQRSHAIKPCKDELDRMYNGNQMTQSQIAKELCVSNGTISIWMSNCGIPTGLQIPPKDELLKCIHDELNQRQIAEHFDVSEWLIFKWYNHYNIHGMVNNFRCTTPEHQKWRDIVLERDNYTCQECGETAGSVLQSHHIKPYCDYPELALDPDNGITLCKQCHDNIRWREYDYIEKYEEITMPYVDLDYNLMESSAILDLSY